MLSITKINCLNFEDFTEHLKNVIEHCPVLAAALWKQKPFDSVSHMVSEMAKIVSALPLSGKLKKKKIPPSRYIFMNIFSPNFKNCKEIH